MSRFLYEINLRTWNGAGGHKGSMLGTNEGKIILGCVSTIFCCFELSLEPSNSSNVLLRHTLLKTKTDFHHSSILKRNDGKQTTTRMSFNHLFLQLSLVNVNLLIDLIERFLKKCNVLLIFFRLYAHFLNLPFFLTKDFNRFSVSTFFFIQFQFDVSNLKNISGRLNTHINFNEIVIVIIIIIITLASSLLMILFPPTMAFASTSSKRTERFLTSISNDFLIASILTMRSCSSCNISTVCFSST